MHGQGPAGPPNDNFWGKKWSQTIALDMPHLDQTRVALGKKKPHKTPFGSGFNTLCTEQRNLFPHTKRLAFRMDGLTHSSKRSCSCLVRRRGIEQIGEDCLFIYSGNKIERHCTHEGKSLVQVIRSPLRGYSWPWSRRPPPAGASCTSPSPPAAPGPSSQTAPSRPRPSPNIEFLR